MVAYVCSDTLHTCVAWRLVCLPEHRIRAGGITCRCVRAQFSVDCGRLIVWLDSSACVYRGKCRYRHIDKYIHVCAHVYIDRYIDEHVNRSIVLLKTQAHRDSDTKTHRRTDTQTHRHTDTQNDPANIRRYGDEAVMVMVEYFLAQAP